MSITEDQVKHIAKLARLEVRNDEIAYYSQNLTRILALVEQMNDINTVNVEPLAHPQDATLRLREDAVTETDQHEHFQQNAPATERGLYLVPKVVE